MSTQIPTLDIRRFDTERDAFVAELGAAYREWGFAGIRGHGIAQALIDDAYADFRAFFALPEEVKRRYHVPGGGGARGYTPFGVETAKGSKHYDLKEFWHVGRELPADSRYRQVMAEYAKHPIDFAEVEAQQFGFSHLPVGSMLLARWNLPETLVEVVRHHHRPDRAPSQSKLSFITAAANGLAHELGLHGHWAVDPWLSRLDIDPEEALSWTESIRLEVEEILGF